LLGSSTRSFVTTSRCRAHSCFERVRYLVAFRADGGGVGAAQRCFERVRCLALLTSGMGAVGLSSHVCGFNE
jgi:hypothetical protein